MLSNSQVGINQDNEMTTSNKKNQDSQYTTPLSHLTINLKIPELCTHNSHVDMDGIDGAP